MFIAHWWWWPSIPTTRVERVESIEVNLWPPMQGGQSQKNATVTTTDRTAIAALLEVLREAKRAGEHKCGSIGSITITRKDGGIEIFEILPGHNSEYYEYRYRGRINRVDRRRFIQALQSIGLEDILSPPSD